MPNRQNGESRGNKRSTGRPQQFGQYPKSEVSDFQKLMLLGALSILESEGFSMPDAEPIIISHPTEPEMVIYTPGHKGSGERDAVIVNSIEEGTVMVGFSPRRRSRIGAPGAVLCVRLLQKGTSKSEMLRIAQKEWLFGVPENA